MDAGWLADPSGRHELRYWDGATWTEHVADAGRQGVDPLPAAAPGAPPAPALVPVAATYPAPTAPEGFILTIGDIGVTPHWVVTPSGNTPLAGSQWIGRDVSRTERKIPTWAIVLAVLFALACLLGLLFLLVKEDQTTGYFEVTVMGPNLQHMTQIPVQSPMQVDQLRRDVGQAQSLAAMARNA